MAKKYTFFEEVAQRVAAKYNLSQSRVDTWRAKGTIPASYIEGRKPRKRPENSGRKKNPNRVAIQVVLSSPAIVRAVEDGKKKEIVAAMRKAAIEFVNKINQ